MKKIIVFISFFLLINCFGIFAQDSIKQQHPVIYTFGYNKLPPGNNLPLIGIINRADENHYGLQLGIMNITGKNFGGLGIGFSNLIGKNNTGIQLGFFNSVGKNFRGSQIGFFNTNGKSGIGLQLGVFNTLGKSFRGVHAGLFNTMGDSGAGLEMGLFNTLGNSYYGLQIGLFNILGNKAKGVQVGFANILGNSLNGLQIGFANIVGNKVNGFGIGFVNITPRLSGLQLGFVNVIDTVTSGFPLGILNNIKHGGYKAVEVGISEMYPVNISFKSGLPRFYSNVGVAYSPVSGNRFALGFGVGSLISLNQKLLFNPELLTQTEILNFWSQITSLNLQLNYKLSGKFQLLAGPSVVLNSVSADNRFHEPVFAFYTADLNSKNRLLLGARLGLRYQIQ